MPPQGREKHAKIFLIVLNAGIAAFARWHGYEVIR